MSGDASKWKLGKVDMRSDTVTQPTPEMKQAMVDAPLGDDVWGDDMTVKDLEAQVANMLGKEAGLYFPSGTMSNLCCMMTWLNRGEAVLLGDRNHICIYEQGGVSGIGGNFAYQIPNGPDGSLDLKELEYKISNNCYDDNGELDYHHSAIRVVSLENPHTLQGGRVSSLQHAVDVRRICDKYKIGLHLDGARMLNAVHHLDMYNDEGIREFSAPYDTISFCLSKGVGAPIGSVLVGPKKFISKARRFRKGLGGGMRQSGMLAAAGIYALKNIAPKMGDDHVRAKKFCEWIKKQEGCSADQCDTNMAFIRIPNNAKYVTYMESKGLFVCAPDTEVVRVAFHHQITDEMLSYLIEETAQFLKNV